MIIEILKTIGLILSGIVIGVIILSCIFLTMTVGLEDWGENDKSEDK